MFWLVPHQKVLFLKRNIVMNIGWKSSYPRRLGKVNPSPYPHSWPTFNVNNPNPNRLPDAFTVKSTDRESIKPIIMINTFFFTSRTCISIILIKNTAGPNRSPCQNANRTIITSIINISLTWSHWHHNLIIQAYKYEHCPPHRTNPQ